jgi:hypothetical protein
MAQHEHGRSVAVAVAKNNGYRMKASNKGQFVKLHVEINFDLNFILNYEVGKLSECFSKFVLAIFLQKVDVSLVLPVGSCLEVYVRSRQELQEYYIFKLEKGLHYFRRFTKTTCQTLSPETMTDQTKN